MDGTKISSAGLDAALDTLFLPFQSGLLAWPPMGEVRFLRARSGALDHPKGAVLSCEQGFKPQTDALRQQGELVSAEDHPPYPLVLLLPPRQRDEARALYARALAIAAPGALVVASLANNEGARSGEADLHRLAGNGTSLSKNKCRAFWSIADAATRDEALAEQWTRGDVPRPIADGRFISRPGLFAWDRLDAASQLLVEHLPPDLRGQGADLGAGYGYLSAEACARCPGITGLDLFEADARALDLARMNLAHASERVALAFHWHDVSTGLPGSYDFILSNPPFHVGRRDAPELGLAFIAAAARALLPGGRLLLVANRHLPYEDLLAASFAQVRTVAVRDGFKLIAATKAAA